MYFLVSLFKFLHIAAAAVWIGGVFALAVLNTRLIRSQDQAALDALAQQSTFYGRAILGPAAAIAGHPAMAALQQRLANLNLINAVQEEIVGVWAGIARPNTHILPPTA